VRVTLSEPIIESETQKVEGSLNAEFRPAGSPPRHSPEPKSPSHDQKKR
jgi:hypothetical protein